MTTRTLLFFVLLLVSLSIIAQPSRAASITNGGFDTGDFTGWNLDTDTSGAGAAPDFQVVDDGSGNFWARLEAGYAGDAVWFANTLWQTLDTSLAPGQELYLSFDWTFAGEAGGPDEVFTVGLGDGSGGYYGADGALGFLVQETSFGAGSFSVFLDPTVFGNAGGWTLEFQLGAGFDQLGSHVLIDNVRLEAKSTPPAPVPEPGTLALLGSGCAALVGAARRRRAGRG